MGAQDSALARPVHRISNFLNHGQGNGAPREQGEDRRWLDGKGPDEEQGWQDRKQKSECSGQEECMEPGSVKGAQSLEAYRLCGDQEGHTLVLESQGDLQPVSAALT